MSKKLHSYFLTLKVKDLISSVVSVHPEDPAGMIRKIFRDQKPRSVAVVGERNKLLGVIYRSSVVALTSRKTNAMAKDLMEDPEYVAREEDPLLETIDNMIKYDEWTSMVTNSKGELLGGLSLDGFIQKGLEMLRSELSSLKVSDFMTKDIISISPEEFILNVIGKMIEQRYSGFPVVDEKGRLVGIITQYDIISKGLTRVELESESGPNKGAKVKRAMTRSVSHLYPWSSILEAAEIMVKRGYGRIPIVNNPREKMLVGIIDREDVAKAILSILR